MLFTNPVVASVPFLYSEPLARSAKVYALTLFEEVC